MPASGPSAASLNAALTSSTSVSRETSQTRSTTEPVVDRGADGEAVQLPLELRQHQAHRLRGAGGGRDQVDGRRPGAAQVFVGHVLEPLVGGVGVDRGHQAALDPDRLVQHLRHRSQAVGRAGGVGDDVVLFRVVGVVEVDSQATVTSGSFAGAEMITFLAPASRCLAASSRLVNSPVDSITTSTPRSPQGSAAGSRSASTLTSRPSTTIAFSRASTVPGKAAVDRVVLEQVGEGGRRR